MRDAPHPFLEGSRTCGTRGRSEADGDERYVCFRGMADPMLLAQVIHLPLFPQPNLRTHTPLNSHGYDYSTSRGHTDDRWSRY